MERLGPARSNLVEVNHLVLLALAADYVEARGNNRTIRPRPHPRRASEMVESFSKKHSDTNNKALYSTAGHKCHRKSVTSNLAEGFASSSSLSTAKKHWHSIKHWPLRRLMVRSIQLRMDAAFVSGGCKQIACLSQRIEYILYTKSRSLDEYGDPSTLSFRLNSLARKPSSSSATRGRSKSF